MGRCWAKDSQQTNIGTLYLFGFERSLCLTQEVQETPGDIVHPATPASEFMTTPHRASDTAATKFLVSAALDVEVGKGEINNAATWDDFPNGRFGDFKSPAYGEPNPWGGSAISVSRLKLSAGADCRIRVRQGNRALSDWGNPKTCEDLTNVFLRHLHSEIATTPFSPTPLSPESLTIFPHLERLTAKGWWTVGSQPAINGADSTDEVVGWGPKGGYVYQKCFVEFFVEKDDVERIEKKVQEAGSGWVDFFAGNLEVYLMTYNHLAVLNGLQGEYWSNVHEGGRDAVTWGVFPGQEIAQSTIIEKESFLAWKVRAPGHIAIQLCLPLDQ